MAFPTGFGFGDTAPATPATRWETFDHGADVGVRGFGPTRERALEQAAVALTAIVTRPAAVAPRRVVEIACEAPADELLLPCWLNAVVYEMATRGMLFSSYRLAIRDGRLWAWAFGEKVDPVRHRPAVEVKGATLSELELRRLDDGSWLAQCVVDV